MNGKNNRYCYMLQSIKLELEWIVTTQHYAINFYKFHKNMNMIMNHLLSRWKRFILPDFVSKINCKDDKLQNNESAIVLLQYRI